MEATGLLRSSALSQMRQKEQTSPVVACPHRWHSRRTTPHQCKKCDHNFEIVKAFGDPDKKKCPDCGKHSLYQVISPPTIFVKGEATTLGQLAERNTSKMGTYELGDKRGKHQEGNLKSKKEKGWIEKSGDATKSDINKMSKKQKANYIRDGKK